MLHSVPSEHMVPPREFRLGEYHKSHHTPAIHRLARGARQTKPPQIDIGISENDDQRSTKLELTR